MTSSQLAPALILPLVAWRLYVRFRRNVGRQAFQPRRLAVRSAIFGGLILAAGFAAAAYPPALAALGGGLLLSLPLALAGFRLTRFDWDGPVKYYTPNTAIGVALTALFLGRVVYRLLVLYGSESPGDGRLPPPLFHSPLTLLIFGLTAGYYLAYSAGLLRRSGRPAAATADTGQ